MWNQGYKSNSGLTASNQRGGSLANYGNGNSQSYGNSQQSYGGNQQSYGGSHSLMGSYGAGNNMGGGGMSTMSSASDMGGYGYSRGGAQGMSASGGYSSGGGGGGGYGEQSILSSSYSGGYAGTASGEGSGSMQRQGGGGGNKQQQRNWQQQGGQGQKQRQPTTLRCTICQTGFMASVKNWNDHINGLKHAQAYLTKLREFGLRSFKDQFREMPGPNKRHLTTEEWMEFMQLESGQVPQRRSQPMRRSPSPEPMRGQGGGGGGAPTLWDRISGSVQGLTQQKSTFDLSHQGHQRQDSRRSLLDTPSDRYDRDPQGSRYDDRGDMARGRQMAWGDDQESMPMRQRSPSPVGYSPRQGRGSARDLDPYGSRRGGGGGRDPSPQGFDPYAAQPRADYQKQAPSSRAEDPWDYDKGASRGQQQQGGGGGYDGRRGAEGRQDQRGQAGGRGGKQQRGGRQQQGRGGAQGGKQDAAVPKELEGMVNRLEKLLDNFQNVTGMSMGGDAGPRNVQQMLQQGTAGVNMMEHKVQEQMMQMQQQVIDMKQQEAAAAQRARAQQEMLARQERQMLEERQMLIQQEQHQRQAHEQQMRMQDQMRMQEQQQRMQQEARMQQEQQRLQMQQQMAMQGLSKLDRQMVLQVQRNMGLGDVVAVANALKMLRALPPNQILQLNAMNSPTNNPVLKSLLNLMAQTGGRYQGHPPTGGPGLPGDGLLGPTPQYPGVRPLIPGLTANRPRNRQQVIADATRILNRHRNVVDTPIGKIDLFCLPVKQRGLLQRKVNLWAKIEQGDYDDNKDKEKIIMQVKRLMTDMQKIAKDNGRIRQRERRNILAEMRKLHINPEKIPRKRTASTSLSQEGNKRSKPNESAEDAKKKKTDDGKSDAKRQKQSAAAKGKSQSDGKGNEKSQKLASVGEMLTVMKDGKKQQAPVKKDDKSGKNSQKLASVGDMLSVMKDGRKQQQPAKSDEVSKQAGKKSQQLTSVGSMLQSMKEEKETEEEATEEAAEAEGEEAMEYEEEEGGEYEEVDNADDGEDELGIFDTGDYWILSGEGLEGEDYYEGLEEDEQFNEENLGEVVDEVGEEEEDATLIEEEEEEGNVEDAGASQEEQQDTEAAEVAEEPEEEAAVEEAAPPAKEEPEAVAVEEEEEEAAPVKKVQTARRGRGRGTATRGRGATRGTRGKKRGS